jgi:hypothetical protein
MALGYAWGKVCCQGKSNVPSAIEQFKRIEPGARVPLKGSDREARVHSHEIRRQATHERRGEEGLEGLSHADHSVVARCESASLDVSRDAGDGAGDIIDGGFATSAVVDESKGSTFLSLW